MGNYLDMDAGTIKVCPKFYDTNEERIFLYSSKYNLTSTKVHVSYHNGTELSKIKINHHTVLITISYISFNGSSNGPHYTTSKLASPLRNT